MHDTGELNNHGNVQREEGEVVIDEVNHVVGSIHLCSKLSQNTCEDDHTKSEIEEDCLDAFGQSKDVLVRVEWSSTLVDNENDEQYHELTSH